MTTDDRRTRTLPPDDEGGHPLTLLDLAAVEAEPNDDTGGSITLTAEDGHVVLVEIPRTPEGAALLEDLVHAVEVCQLRRKHRT